MFSLSKRPFWDYVFWFLKQIQVVVFFLGFCCVFSLWRWFSRILWGVSSVCLGLLGVFIPGSFLVLSWCFSGALIKSLVLQTYPLGDLWFFLELSSTLYTHSCYL